MNQDRNHRYIITVKAEVGVADPLSCTRYKQGCATRGKHPEKCKEPFDDTIVPKDGFDSNIELEKGSDYSNVAQRVQGNCHCLGGGGCSTFAFYVRR